MYKILQINVAANSGSTGRITENIHQILVEEGYGTYIAYGRINNSSKAKLIKIGNKLSIYNHVLLTRFTDKHGLGSKRATKKLIRQIKDLSPALIHLHNIHGYYINYKLLFSFLKESEIPVVWTLHDCWFFTGHCAFFDFVNCRKWKTTCNNCPQLREYPISFVDRSEKNFSDKEQSFTGHKNLTLVPVSNWLNNLISDSFLNNYPRTVIHNGIDLNVFKYEKTDFRKRYSLENKTIVLGVASVWDRRKGFEDFIKLSKFLTNDFSIVLVGLTRQQIKKLPENILGIARTESIDELVGIYSTADVLFNPTWEDNFPTTNLEAIACGTPVITYKTGGSIESVNDTTGFVIDKGNINEAFNKIEVIKNRGKDYYKNNCREYALKNFDARVNFVKYLEIYKNFLEE